MDEVRLHVQSLDGFFAEARRMARQIDRGEVKPEAADVAFESMEALLRALTANRWVMLRRLRSLGPSSIRALSKALGRDYRGVHADVGVLVGLGLVERRSDGKMFVPWSRITAEMSLDEAA